MEISQFAVCLSAAVAAYMMFCIGVESRRASRYKQLCRTEALGRRLADARYRLMIEARDGKIDTQSETFRRMYRMQTFILRRPDKHDEIANRLAEFMLQSVITGNRATSGLDRLRDESRTWTPAAGRQKGIWPDFTTLG